MRIMGLIVGGEFGVATASGVSVGLIEHSVGWGFFAGLVAAIGFLLVAPLMLGVTTLLHRKPEPPAERHDMTETGV
jgi:hypothetical protein